MLQTLKTILVDNWEWRDKIAHLARFELVKKSRGTILSWAWFVIRPAIYVFCFWFALDIGLRGARAGATEGVPYIVWLAAGIIPWFFMSEVLGEGSDVLHKFSYLVTKVKFPLSAVSTIQVGSSFIVQLILQVGMLAIYFINGMQLDVYLLQVPLALLMLFVFWNIFSIFYSQLSAFSKDASNLLKALSTPLFWLSGVIFNIKAVPIDWVQTLLQYNPVTFFVVVFRDAYCDKVWFWDDPNLLFGFVVVFVVTFVLMLVVYKRLNKEVADVL